MLKQEQELPHPSGCGFDGKDTFREDDQRVKKGRPCKA